MNTLVWSRAPLTTPLQLINISITHGFKITHIMSYHINSLTERTTHKASCLCLWCRVRSCNVHIVFMKYVQGIHNV